MSKIIDFHQHLVALGKVEEHAKLMDINAVRLSLLIPFPTEIVSIPDALPNIGMKKKSKNYIDAVLKPLNHLNNELIRYVNNFNNIEPSDPSDGEKPKCRFVPVPWIPLGLKELEIPKTPDGFLPIVKFIPIFDNVKDNRNYWNKMDTSINLTHADIITIHTGWGSPILPLLEIIKNHPDVIFVLMHMKEDFDQDNIDRKTIMKECDNVYLETSYVPHSKRIYQYVRDGFGDRLLFGSDYRTSDDLQSLRGFVQVIKESDITHEDMDNILYNNAYHLLKSIGVLI